MQKSFSGGCADTETANIDILMLLLLLKICLFLLFISETKFDKKKTVSDIGKHPKRCQLDTDMIYCATPK